MRTKRVATVLIAGIFALVLGFTGSAVSADKFPSRTITWLIPYGPAGGFDLHSRAMIVGMKKALGVNIIIRNRPGRAETSPGTSPGAPSPTAIR